ncbi:unnamed protein product [Camellia sinensis]
MLNITQSVKVHACVGGTSVREDQRILSSGVHVVVGTPGRVFDMLRRQSLRPVYIKMFVLDEADEMLLYDACKEILKIQKFRRMVSYAGFYGFVTVISYAYTSNTTRAGYSRADQFYASYPAGTELLTDTAKLYKAALGNCFEEEEWGPIEWCIMAKHFERQGKSPYAYHATIHEGMRDDSKEFVLELFDALSRRRRLNVDKISRDELYEYWSQITDQSFDSRLQIFFDI